MLTIRDSLATMPLFDNTYLFMQAQNVDIVDSYLVGIEEEMIEEYNDKEKTPVAEALYVNAFSQFWLFGLYELLRTWRQISNNLIGYYEMLKKTNTKDEKNKIKKQYYKSLEKSKDITRLDNVFYRNWLECVEGDDEFICKIYLGLDLVRPLFADVEKIRVTIAKHEIPRTRNVHAMAPGYARIDRGSNSLCWMIVLKDGSMEIISRRNISDRCKMIGEDFNDRHIK